MKTKDWEKKEEPFLVQAKSLLFSCGVRVDTIDLDDRRTLGQISSDNDLDNSINFAECEKKKQDTYGNGHQFLYFLDLVARVRDSKTLKLWNIFRHGTSTLIRGILRRRGNVIAAQYDLIIVSIIFVEKCTFIMDGTRGHLHFQSMLLSIFLHFLQMLVIAVFNKPSDDIFIRPVDLQRMRMFVVDMVLLD